MRIEMQSFLEGVLPWEWGGTATYDGFSEYLMMVDTDEPTQALCDYLIIAGENPADYLEHTYG